MPFYPFLGEGSPTKINYRKMGALVQTSLLEDLVQEFADRVAEEDRILEPERPAASTLPASYGEAGLRQVSWH